MKSAVKDIGGDKAKVEVLLAAYNGGPYIRELLESLLRQAFTDWRLVARDDGSADDTVGVIREYCERFPKRIALLRDEKGRLGPRGSFAALLERSSAPYMMFCDQDDVWLPGKIGLTLERMKAVEAQGEGPVLVHTDMKVVDSSLGPISESFWRYQNLDPSLKSLNNLLVSNNVTGCTVMINRDLKSMSLPIPSAAPYHDWWLALVAAAFGRIDYIDAPTVLYRQHGKNDTGARKYSAGYFISRAGRLDLARKTVAQARAFRSIYGKRLGGEALSAVDALSGLLSMSRLKRLYVLRKHGFRASGFVRNAGLKALLTIAAEGDEDA